MIRNGKYAKYRGNEFSLSGDMDGNIIIVTKDKSIIDSTFEDTYNTGVYSKVVDESQLEDIYSVVTYVLLNGEKLVVRKEEEGGYLVGTSDYEIAKKLSLDRVDKYGYEGWVSKDNVVILEEII